MRSGGQREEQERPGEGMGRANAGSLIQSKCLKWPVFTCAFFQMCWPWLSLNVSFGRVFRRTWANRGVKEQHQKQLE